VTEALGSWTCRGSNVEKDQGYLPLSLVLSMCTSALFCFKTVCLFYFVWLGLKREREEVTGG
jgi:hypothetical protein